jgi:hypothetical protein
MQCLNEHRYEFDFSLRISSFDPRVGAFLQNRHHENLMPEYLAIAPARFSF